MAAIDLVLAIGVVGVSAFALYFLAEKAFVNYSHVVSVMVGWPYV